MLPSSTITTKSKLAISSFYVKQSLSFLLSRLWPLFIASGHLLFIAFTALIPYLPLGSQSGLLQAFNLAAETNVAAWWSAMNLLILALLAAELVSLDERAVRLPWGILVLILALLSLDELGSLHERVGGFRELLPYMVIAIVLLAYSMGSLFLRRGTRRVSLWIGVGFALFAAAILQERLEHLLFWPEWARGARVGVEEGSELVGMFVILWGLLSYRRRLVGGHALMPPDPLRIPAPRLVLLAGFALHLLLTLLPLEQASAARWGEPGLWFPAAAFFALGLAAGCQGARDRGVSSLAWVCLSALFLFSSLAVVYLLVPRPAGSWILSLGLITNFYFFTAWLVFAAGFLHWLRSTNALRRNLPLFLLLAAAVGVAWILNTSASSMLLAGVAALLLSWLSFHRDVNTI